MYLFTEFVKGMANLLVIFELPYPSIVSGICWMHNKCLLDE